MTDYELAQFLSFLCDGARFAAGLDDSSQDWIAIPAQHPGKPAPKRPDLPYISALRMDTWEIGIPYEYVFKGQGYMTAHAGSAYSIQFHGDDSNLVARRFSLWVRSSVASRNRFYLPNPWRGRATANDPALPPYDSDTERYYGERKQNFYIRECSADRNVSGLVNGIWEERAVINMKLEHRIFLGEGAIADLESGEVRVYQEPNRDRTPPDIIIYATNADWFFVAPEPSVTHTTP